MTANQVDKRFSIKDAILIFPHFFTYLAEFLCFLVFSGVIRRDARDIFVWPTKLFLGKRCTNCRSVEESIRLTLSICFVDYHPLKTRGLYVKISTKGRYGLRTLMDIAMHQAKGTVTLNDIAKRQGISVKYLWQVINPLKTAGVLRVTRGAKGGYLLARSPSEITLFEIVTILEGDLALVACLNEQASCSQIEVCAARTVWEEVSRVVRETLDGITLADVLKRCKTPEGAANYVI